MIHRLPQLTKFYGIKPVDIDSMTFGEITEYIKQMEEYLAKEEG